MARAAKSHDESHGGIIAEASMETRSESAIDEMMRGADSNDRAGGSVDFDDALEEEDLDLLGDPQPTESNLAEGAGGLIAALGDKLGSLRRGKPGDTDGDGVPDEVDTDDDDDGVPDSLDQDADGDGQPDPPQDSSVGSSEDSQQDGTPRSRESMEDLRSSLADAPSNGAASGLEDLQQYKGQRIGGNQGAETRDRGRAEQYIDPRYRDNGQEPRRGGRGFGQFRIGR